jgi:hypothetical protein
MNGSRKLEFGSRNFEGGMRKLEKKKLRRLESEKLGAGEKGAMEKSDRGWQAVGWG